MRRFFVVGIAVGFVGGCSAIQVTPSGSGVSAAPRATDCTVEFFHTKPPERPYDELATIHYRGATGSAFAAQEALREKACAAGADAVIVVRDFVPQLAVMTGTAIRYRRMPAEAQAEAAKLAAPAVPAAPAGFVNATTTRATKLRSGPDASAPAREELPAGTPLSAAGSAARGFRQVMTAAGVTGYVEEAALRIGGEAPAAR